MPETTSPSLCHYRERAPYLSDDTSARFASVPSRRPRKVSDTKMLCKPKEFARDYKKPTFPSSSPTWPATQSGLHRYLPERFPGQAFRVLCRTQSSAVRAPEVGEHNALQGAR